MATIRKIVCGGAKKLRGTNEVIDEVFQIGYTFQINNKNLSVSRIEKSFIGFQSDELEHFIPCYSIFIALGNSELHWEDVSASDVRKVEYEIPNDFLSSDENL